MCDIPKISEAEYEVMKIVWHTGSLTANEIVDSLVPESNWAPKTIRTLINRLLKKKALRYEVRGKSYLYSPAISKNEYIAVQSESFLDQIFDGALMPMLSYFAKSKKLSPGDIEKLKSLLEEKDNRR
jgi:BlaI family penicillinase repressor